jgi:hypothetical protein
MKIGVSGDYNRLLGHFMGERITTNWFGSFSSGRAGILSVWGIGDGFYNFWELFFERGPNQHSRRVERYPELEMEKGNGNLGSQSYAFNATPENIKLVKRILTQAGYEIDEKLTWDNILS